MTVVTVQERGQTQNGKPKVKIAGEWFFLARDIGDLPPIGVPVEIREGFFTFRDGKRGKTVEAWRPVNGQAPASVAPPAGYVDEASMRFISNCVGSAITAGTIKEPGQIKAWFTAAKAALEGKDAPIPFDDSADDWSRQ